MLTTTLPVELILRILSNVSFADIVSVKATSHDLCALIESNEHIVYHELAISYGYVAPHVSLEDASLAPCMDDVVCWKEFCRRKLLIQRRWNGKDQDKRKPPSNAKVCVGALKSPGEHVESFAIDEKHRTVISNSTRGGIDVTAIETDRILWRLPETYVDGGAECRFSNGFLTFMRSSPPAIEVWRRTADIPLFRDIATGNAVPTPVFNAPASPGLKQAQASASASKLAVLSEEPESPRFAHILGDWKLRGHFSAHALQRIPTVKPISSYCFSFPLVAAVSDDTVFVFDVRNGRLLGDIPQKYRVVDVVLSHEHLGISTDNAITIIPLSQLISGTGGLCLDHVYPEVDTSNELEHFGEVKQDLCAVAFGRDGKFEGVLMKSPEECPRGICPSSTVLLESGNVIRHFMLEYKWIEGLQTGDPLRLVCISPDQRHAIARTGSYLIFIRNFSKWTGGHVPRNSVRILRTCGEVTDALWTRDGLVIANVRDGIHLGTVQKDQVNSDEQKNWIIYQFRLQNFRIFKPFRRSRMVVTETGIWFLHTSRAVEHLLDPPGSHPQYPRYAYGEERERGTGIKSNVCFIDLATDVV